jgi:hypothetical protein
LQQERYKQCINHKKSTGFQVRHPCVEYNLIYIYIYIYILQSDNFVFYSIILDYDSSDMFRPSL